MAIYKELRGTWLCGGYIQDLAARSLVIAIVDGIAYDAELYDAPCGSPFWPEDSRITLCSDGELRAWGESASFAPDAGEIEKIGANVFAKE